MSSESPPLIESRDPAVFGRNVRAFRALRRWGVRELAQRSGVSTKTIVRIERGEGCTSRTERKIALGFSTYVGRLWDSNLLSNEDQRLILQDRGRWFFADVRDAERYHERLMRTQDESSDERLRSDPDEIQIEAERHRLGHAGLSTGFVKTGGGGFASGYYQYNQCEIFARDHTPPDGLNYNYVILCGRGGVRIGIREKEYELREGDGFVFNGGASCWIEPAGPLAANEPPPLLHFICLGVLALPKV